MMQHSHALYSFIYRHRRACLIGGAVLGGVIIAAVVLYRILARLVPTRSTLPWCPVTPRCILALGQAKATAYRATARPT